MQVEPARDEDLSAIAEVWHRGWHQAHGAIVSPELVTCRSPAEFEARTRKRLQSTWIARKDGELAGFFMTDGDEIYQFYLDAPFRGSGLALSLMAAAEAQLAGRKAWLACSVGNDRAARFYRKAGWSCEATEVYEVETAQGTQTVDIWRYEKDLS